MHVLRSNLFTFAFFYLRTYSKVAAAWRLHSERQPLIFFDRELLPGMVKSLHALATTPGTSTFCACTYDTLYHLA